MSFCLNPDCSHQNAPADKFCQKCRSKLVLRERYRAIKLIGQGGFGKTFQAVDEDKPSKPYCVIKQFFPQAQGTGTLQKAAELFKEEAIRLDSLGKHPRIPELYAYFTGEDERQYLVQEYIEGQNLERELKEEGTFTEAKIRQLLAEILPILEFIHGKQVIHRDITPQNIIRRKADNGLVLVDFGAAKLVTPLNRSVTGTVIGAAEYVAPEQSNGKAVNASDLYSLGVTCIYLLTGISPFDLFDMGEHEWIWRQYLVNNSVSNDLGNILDKLIEFGTKRRYQSAREVLQDLRIKSAIFTSQQIIQNPVNSLTSLPKNSPFPQLKSTRGIDYTTLRDLLVQGKWQEADEETANLIRKVTNRVKDWLRDEDIQKFPCDDLRTIDQLWVYYSDGKFGFSVQAQIYRGIGGMEEYNEKNWDVFGNLVGWQKNNVWCWQDVNYNLKAPQGHLPLIRYGYKGQGNSILYHLTSRVFSCQLSSNPIINQKQPVTPIIQLPPTPVPTPSTSPILQSARGVDYRKLEDLLKQGKWKEADEENSILMLQAANRTNERWLRVEDIDNFPCEDLRTLDWLWVKYSEGHFGFSVQAKIYRDLGGTSDYNEKVWNAFGEKVGWRINNGWIDYKDAIFDLKALQGHLLADVPIWRCGNWHDPIWWASVEAVKRGISLFSRVETCQVTPTIIQSPPSPILQSARGVDYRKLEDLLKRQQWKEANEETARVMLQAASKIKGTWLKEEDIENFPSEDLQTIDRLWIYYSQGQFGLSIQKQIYQNLGGTRDNNEKEWQAFGERVGWRVNNHWIFYRDVTFALSARQGHLPTVASGREFGFGVGNGIFYVSSLLSHRDL